MSDSVYFISFYKCIIKKLLQDIYITVLECLSNGLNTIKSSAFKYDWLKKGQQHLIYKSSFI